MTRSPKRLDAAELLDFALRSLSSRAMSIGELRTKLTRRATHPEDVTEVMSKLKQVGYLNDRTFADSFATARLASQGFGKARVLRDLRQRQVPPNVAEKAVEQAYQDSDETELILKFLGRKYRNRPLATLLKEPKELASAYRKLRLAGFSSAASIRVLKNYAAEADLLEDSADLPDDSSGVD